MKNCHLRARLPEAEFSALKTAADRAGLSISEYVRCVLLRDQQALGQEQFLQAMERKLAASSATNVQTDRSLKLERLLIEVLMIARELAADRNAQILARVAQKLNPTNKGEKHE